MRIFGEEAYVYIQDKFRSKLDSKGEKVNFVGYTDKMNTFRFYCPGSDSILIRCDTNFTNRITEVDVDIQSYSPDEEEDLTGDDSIYDEVSDVPIKNSAKSESKSPATPNQSLSLGRLSGDISGLKTKIPKNLDIGVRNPKPPEIFKERTRAERINLAALEAANDPTNYKEAMEREDSAQWEEAMRQELESLEKNNVWELVDRPKDENIVTNRWVFVIKRKPDGKIDRYKARLVARGFTQVFGLDYNETYAPVVDCASIRLLLAYAAANNLFMGQFDVKTAFLNGELEETIYMEQPEGLNSGEDKVCLLKKSLYGLKQAPRQWNLCFTQILQALGLNISENDDCIFYKREPLIVIGIYVDDGIIISDQEKVIYL